MRISDWSSDVCSSDLPVRRRFGGARRGDALPGGGAAGLGRAAGRCRGRGRSGGGALGGGLHPPDRKSVAEGKSVSVRVDIGGRRSIKKQTTTSSKRTNNI